MKNIYFIGFMGTGKTTVSKMIAERLNKKWVDLDEIIQEKEGRNIVDIFRDSGEEYFRSIEKEVLKEIADSGNFIVSTGGGIVIVDENVDIMKKSGILVTLVASPEVIYERLKDDHDRPLLQVPNPMDEIKRLMFERAPFYIKGDIIIDTSFDKPEKIVEDILLELEKLEKVNGNGKGQG